MNSMGVTATFLLDYASLKGNYIWYSKPGQKPMAKKVTGHSWETTAVDVMCLLNCLLNIYAHAHRLVSIAVSFRQRKFLFAVGRD